MTPSLPLWIAADHPALRYTGRIVHTAQGAGLYWPCSSVSFWTDAPRIAIHTADTTGANHLAIQWNADPPQPCPAVFCPPKPGVITVTKRTEGTEGVLWLNGLSVPQNSTLKPTKEPSMRLVFYGDSITTGHAMHGAAAHPENNDPQASFAALTAQALGAAFHCIAQSGLGLCKSWTAETLLDLWDGIHGPDHRWDFQQWTPDVVIINIGQNDHWLGTGVQLQPAYEDLVSRLRRHHPTTPIVVSLGSMSACDPKTPTAIALQDAVSALRAQGDQHVYSMLFPCIPGGHPSPQTHRKMAAQLVQFVSNVLEPSQGSVHRSPSWSDKFP